MTIIAEFDSEDMVNHILKQSRGLAGTDITLERDLNSVRQENKKALLQLKKDIVAIDKTHPIKVRDDSMKISDKWIKWNKEQQLVCGKEKGTDIFKKFYGNKLDSLNLEYSEILKKISNK